LDWVSRHDVGGNPQIDQPMVEYRKSTANLNGMPLRSFVSVGMGPNPGITGQGSGRLPVQSRKKETVISKGLGGMLGGFGKKKQRTILKRNPQVQANRVDH